MNKYDRMIEINRERSDEKIAAAKLAIQKLLDQVLLEYFLKRIRRR